MNFGIIDIGSNTVRVVVYKVEGKHFECLFNEKQFVQLIGYVRKGVVEEEGVANLISALRQLKELASHYNLKELKCFATAPFRAVNDQARLIEIVKESTGLVVEVLDGDEEAILGLTGARYINNANDGLFVDLGGGSIEVSLLKSGEIVHAQSIDMGCVNLSNKFVSGILPSEKEMKDMKRYIDKRLTELEWLKEAEGLDMYGIGGTARALGQIHRALAGIDIPIQKYSINPSEIKGVYKTIQKMKLDGIKLLTKYCPGRIFTFIPGTLVLWRLARRIRPTSLRFNIFGVREGYLINRIMLNKETASGKNKETRAAKVK